jgi:hypothetical protein
MAQTNRKTRSRPDFTNTLIHFTRGRNCRERHWEEGYQKGSETVVPAFDVLKEIYLEGTIRASTTKSGFIKGRNTAVCLSEVPLSGIRYFAGEGQKYECYGVAVSKRSAFSTGARPVIYLPDSEGDWIPTDQRWRHVRFDPPSVDHTWEREWRKKGDLELKEVLGCYFFVWTPEERQMLLKLKTPLTNVRGILCMDHLLDMM